MRKINIFLAVLSLFLLVPASITRAQVTKTLNGIVRYESGMSKTTFETPNGKIVTSLPQSLTGTTITGTVVAEPAGKTEKEKSRNLKELVKLVINLDGQKFPVSATPSSFDWLTNLDRQQRTPIELLNVSGYKLVELSLPPVLKAPATFSSGNAPRLTTPSNVLVKGDALNVYTDQQFSPGERFILTDSKGQQHNLKPVALSSNQAVLEIPKNVAPGRYTVNDNVKFNLIDLGLSSPNTNLRRGQTSSVTLSIDTRDPSEIDTVEFMYFSVDMKNLTPEIVNMTGGNMQTIRFPLNDNRNDPSAWRLNRSITGVKPGDFAVSATLHEDYNTSNDPFRPQLNVLRTPEDFNAWANALKNDLQQYVKVSYDDETGNAIKSNTQRAIDNMPVCSNPEQLDESKAVAYSLLRPLPVSKQAASSWLCSSLIPGGLLFATKWTPKGMTTLPVEVTDIYWKKLPTDETQDVICVDVHFTGDFSLKELAIRVNWVSKDGKKNCSADFIFSWKDGVEFHNCTVYPVGVEWPDDFKPTGLCGKPPPKDELDLGKTKVVVSANGEKVGEGIPGEGK